MNDLWTMSQSLSSKEIHGLLDEAYERFATPVFIALDPIQVPRSFSKREDEKWYSVGA